MPARKKPPEKVLRRNKPQVVDAQLVAIQGQLSAPPEPPERISESLIEEWNEMWGSDLATTFDRKVHVSPLRRLFKLRNMVERYEEEAEITGPLSTGSTGQTSIHPLLIECDKLRVQILAIEDRFGLSSLSKMKLGIATGDAHKSLDEMNRRIVGQTVSERPDPRLVQDG